MDELEKTRKFIEPKINVIEREYDIDDFNRPSYFKMKFLDEDHDIFDCIFEDDFYIEIYVKDIEYIKLSIDSLNTLKKALRKYKKINENDTEYDQWEKRMYLKKNLGVAEISINEIEKKKLHHKNKLTNK